MSDALMAELRSGGPVSPAVQMRKLLAHGRVHGWEFDVAWKWSMERVRFPHDTSHRRDWRGILGETFDDPRPLPTAHRDAWRSAYERTATPVKHASVGRLLVAV